MVDQIVGLGRSMKRLEKSRALGAIDIATTDPAEAFAGADAVILCTPPRTIRKVIPEIAPLIEPGAFVTDVGSVKQAIVATGQKFFDGMQFIGSHPMAGSERAGVEAARGDLFEGAGCFITPVDETPASALTLAHQFWRAVGCRVIVVHPKRHDDLLASISHLPHLVAVAMVQNLYKHGDSTPYLRSVVGNGFRDTTRIAAGSADVWEQIFTENSEAVIRNIDEMIETLGQWRAMLEKGSGTQIHDALDRISGYRRQLSDEADTAEGGR